MVRSQKNTNRNTHILITNHSTGTQPALVAPIRLSGHGACHPPRNRVVASADTVAMLMYSASMNMANLSEEYSV